MKSVIFCVSLILSSPAYAVPCPLLKWGITTYGDKTVQKYALSKGYTVKQYRQAKKECHLG